MIFWFLLFIISPCQSQTLKGFKFEDNLIEARFGPENGYAIYDTGFLKVSFYQIFEQDKRIFGTTIIILMLVEQFSICNFLFCVIL